MLHAALFSDLVHSLYSSLFSSRVLQLSIHSIFVFSKIFAHYYTFSTGL